MIWIKRVEVVKDKPVVRVLECFSPGRDHVLPELSVFPDRKLNGLPVPPRPQKAENNHEHVAVFSWWFEYLRSKGSLTSLH